jgi:dCTP deaminase
LRAEIWNASRAAGWVEIPEAVAPAGSCVDWRSIGLAPLMGQAVDARIYCLRKNYLRTRRFVVRSGEMGILCDSQIRELIGIEPFEENLKRPGKISYGVSSYGYDLRVGSVFKIFTNVNSEIVDPKRFSERSFVTIDTDEERRDHVLIPPNSFALCETVEVVSMPRGYLAICVGKSTYARCGIIVNVTPIEPEWRGRITLEISNTTPLPARIYANEGIAQLIFLKGERVCTTSYADKSGKYQDQKGLTLPKVD